MTGKRPKPEVAGARRHRGDIMSAETRSAVMSRIRGKDTGPERKLGSLLLDRGLDWVIHDRGLPGRPDFVFPDRAVAVFVDGDLWHGWRFPTWRDKLSAKWEAKIAANIARDRRNHQRLRRQGWRVVRIWEHQLDRDPAQCLDRVLKALSR